MDFGLVFFLLLMSIPISFAVRVAIDIIGAVIFMKLLLLLIIIIAIGVIGRAVHRQRSEFGTFKIRPGESYSTWRKFPRGEPFLLTIAGYYSLYAADLEWYMADALYYRSSQYPPGMFTDPYAGLHIDGRNDLVIPFAEDRYRYTYSFLYIGTGEPLTLYIKPPRKPHKGEDSSPFDGKLSVTVSDPLSPSKREAIEAELRRREEEVQRAAEETAQRHAAEQQRKEEEAARKATEELERNKWQPRLRDLHHRYDLRPHLADPAYLADYVKKHKSELLRERDAILADHAKFAADEGFLAYAARCEPSLLERAQWKVKALALAEQLDVIEPSPPPRRKRTAEEVTELMVRKLQVKLRDHEAVLKAGHAWLEAQEEDLLAGMEDEDEREHMRQHLKAVLGQTLDELTTDQQRGGTTNGPAKVL